MPQRSNKFAERFSEPVDFGDGILVLSRETNTREEAAVIFSAWWNDGVCANVSCPAEKVQADFVRWQFLGEWVEDGKDACPGWQLGVTGRGAKPVWVWEMY